ncbi:GNAT family N-acetyltransferase [Actinomycetaceae bacterium L2_0104]
MSSPHVFVRQATSLDAQAIGDIQARTMRAALVAATGKRLAPEIEDQLQPEAFASAWADAIASPPSAGHLVFSAVSDGQVVGFAALSPTALRPIEPTPSAADVSMDGATGEGARREGSESRDDGEEERGDVVVEITALEVPPAYQRAGHGSRLLAALAQTAQERGATELQIWLLAGDDAHTAFITAAGFAPAGLRRDLHVGEELVSQHCWHALLQQADQDD